MDGVYFTTNPLEILYPTLGEAYKAAEPYRVGALLAAGFHGTAAGWQIEIRGSIPEDRHRSGVGHHSVWVTR